MNKNKIFLKMAIGFIAGIISGLFSTGGGMILVPAFIFIKNQRYKSKRNINILYFTYGINK